MRLGLVGLVVALAIVAVLAKKQMNAARLTSPVVIQPAADQEAVSDVGAAKDGTTVRQHSQQIQQQVQQQMDALMQQPRVMQDDADHQ